MSYCIPKDEKDLRRRALLAGSSITVPVSQGRLALGTWQGIYLFEHRTQGHAREIIVTLLA